MEGRGTNRGENLQRKEEKGEKEGEGEGNEKNRKVGRPNKEVWKYIDREERTQKREERMGAGGAWSEWSEREGRRSVWRESICGKAVHVHVQYMYSKCACVGEESTGGNILGVVFSCRFLFDNQSPAHIYYRWKLFSILQV